MKFRQHHLGTTGHRQEPRHPLRRAAAAAITTVTYINKPTDATADGRIIDADIELNAVNNYFYNADQAAPNTGQRKATDLWNTLTHESAT